MGQRACVLNDRDESSCIIYQWARGLRTPCGTVKTLLSSRCGVLLACLGVAAAVPTMAAQTVSSAANQKFVVGNPPTDMSAITITDANPPRITAANDIRVRIPLSFNMTWNTALTTATITGGAAGKVSTTVSYEDGGHTLVVDVTTNFAAADKITISGLQYMDFTAPSATDNLELVTSGPGGAAAALDNRTITIRAATISSAANQTFTVAQPATAASTITVTDANPPTITAANDIRVRIPASLNMIWNTAITTVTLGGNAAGKVSAIVTYEDGGKTLVLNVTNNFGKNQNVTVSGPQFMNFTSPSGPDSLELVVSGLGGATTDFDNTTKTIVAPRISSAGNQLFGIGQAATAISPVTITDATSPTITAANDIRIRIPPGFNMTWNTALTTATIGGGAAGKVSTTVSYENSGQVLVLNVTANFAAGDQITVSGLQFHNFTAASAANNLQLVVSGAGGGTAATDDKTITITTLSVAVSPHATTASRLPSNGTNYTVSFTVQNTGAGTDSYDLLTSKQPGTVLATVSIAGSGITQGANPDSARLSNLSAGGSVTATVTYSVGNAAAGATDTLTFTARSVASPGNTDRGRLTVTVVRPNLTLAKAVNPSGTQPPGTSLTYTLTLTNAGTSNAASVVLVDTLRPTVQFKVGSVSNSLPAGVTVLVDYSNDGGATWTYVPASGACSAPATYDRCVNRVRWSLQNPLGFTAPDNTGTLQFVAQIR